MLRSVRSGSVAIDSGRRQAPLITGLIPGGVEFDRWMSVPQGHGGASASWPGLSGPTIAARAGGDGPDKPGHDDKATATLNAGWYQRAAGIPNSPCPKLPSSQSTNSHS